MKKPDEIKKGLEHCINGEDCTGCTYHDDCATALDCNPMHKDLQAYIHQLESKLHQAVEDIRMLGRTGEFICPVCAHYNHGEGTKGECVKCLTGDGFRWRGEKDGKKAD